MVWPFTSRDTSAATFEKTLSNLSTKITRAQSKDSSLRSTSRRYKALWTLYTSFVYIVYTIVLVLVTGYERWGLPEYGAVAGGPLLILGVRLLIGAVYGWIIARNHIQLESYKRQKAEAVRKFKEATRYSETEKLLEKYGAEVRKLPEEQSEGVRQQEKKKRDAQAQHQNQQPRTNIQPPPTANIQRPPQPGPLPPQPFSQGQQPPPYSGSPESPSDPLAAPSRRRDSTASFAPNASDDYPSAPQYVESSGRHWYDRLMDVILGEDETKPINRVALICVHCKLVNGQAPPGIKDVGRWKCMSCKEWNGEENHVRKVLQDINEERDKEDMAEMLREISEEEEDGTDEGGKNKALQKAIKRRAESGAHGERISTPAQSTRSRKSHHHHDT